MGPCGHHGQKGNQKFGPCGHPGFPGYGMGGKGPKFGPPGFPPFGPKPGQQFGKPWAQPGPKAGPDVTGRPGGPQAGPPHHSITEIFQHFDKKKNGKITKDEVPDQAWQRLVKIGAVKNGVVTMQSLGEAIKKLQGQHRPGGPAAKPQGGPGGPKAGQPGGQHRPGLSVMFQQWDKKKNGKLTKDEVPAAAWDHFVKMGAVKDGVVTMQSLTDAFKRQGQHRPGGPAARPQGGPTGTRHAGWQGGPNRPNMPKAGGGTLVLQPTVDQMWQHLTKIGAVQNGVVTKASLQAAFKKRQAERQKQQPPASN